MHDDARRAEVGAHVLHVRVADRAVRETEYAELLRLMGEVTPVVQPLPPAAALADVAGALRYWERTPYELAQRIRAGALAAGLPVQIGVAATWAVAAVASAHPGRGGIRVVPDHHQAVRAFLDPLPVGDLYGVGPVQAAMLEQYGLTTVGRLARQPLQTVQRILGGREVRLVHERARGIDPRPVTPSELPQSISVQQVLDRDTLDPHLVRTEILDAVVDLAHQLRERRQVAQSLTLGVSFSGGSSVSRSRTLAKPSAFTDDLRDAAIAVFERLGLERARVRGVSVRLEHLIDEAGTAQQLSLDPGRENSRRLDPVVDRLNARFGPGTVTRGTLAPGRHSA
ncbi:hypothetical protein OH779_40310 [Actinacidiphila glaucinigra]|uniref:DNA polymerase Y family protein n=1 Tax=Actinacidiphila glaucinigra TaxID=235986 RepID=UPI00386EE876